MKLSLRVVALPLALLGVACERGDDDDDPPGHHPTVTQPTVAQPTTAPPGAPVPGAQPAVSFEQRVVWAEQRIVRLEQQDAVTAQELQAMRQQIGRAHV